MKFENDGKFFVISNSYIKYLIKKHKNTSFFLEFDDKYEVVVKVEVKEKDNDIT